MTATLTRTQFAPNPPQLEDPWVKILTVVLLGVLAMAALFALGS